MCFTFILISRTWHANQGNMLLTHLYENYILIAAHSGGKKSVFLILQLPSKPGFFRQTSERRSFKLLELRKINRDAGISTSSRISPPSTPSSPDDTPCLSGDPYNRRRRKIPKVRARWGAPLCSRFTVMRTAQGGLELFRSRCHLEMSKGGKLFWWIFPVRSVPGKRPPPCSITKFWVGLNAVYVCLNVCIFIRLRFWFWRQHFCLRGPCRWCWKLMPSLRLGGGKNAWKRCPSPLSTALVEVWLLNLNANSM